MSTSTEPSTTPTADTTTTRPVLELEPIPVSAAECSESFAKGKPGCSTEFGNILYSTDQQEFWLLPQRASSAIKEAIHTLSGQIAADKPADERKKGLDQCALLDYFLEPKLSNFLTGSDQARLIEIEAQEPHIADPALAMRVKTSQRREAASQLAGPPAPEYNRAQVSADQQQYLDDQNEHQRLIRLNGEWKALNRKAVAQAQNQGYTYEAGSLYLPQAIEARRRVQDYLEKRETVLGGEAITVYQAEEIAKLLAEDKQRMEQQTDCRINCQAQFMGYLTWRYLERSKLDFADYRESILKVAEYGLAVPEFALLADSGADITAGIELFKQYVEMDRQQRKLNDQLRAKYKGWIEATGQNAPAPAGLVAEERTQWDALQVKKEALRSKAEANVAATVPSRHLIWTPEEFKPNPVERLVKSDFPLREVSILDTPKKPLSYFSLFNLGNIGQQLKGGVKKSLGKSVEGLKGKPESSNGKAGTDTAYPLFREWLITEGAVRIPDQAGPWFDAQGWFDVDLFHHYLKDHGYKVDQLETTASRQEWGERLRQLLFKDKVRDKLRLFDHSPQAQLVRCLTPPQESIHQSLKLEGPSFSQAEGFKASAKATFDIDLARGEVELFKVDLPDRQNAQALKLPYTRYDKSIKDLNLGRFSMHLGARAWGFAGASLLLSADLEVSPKNLGIGANLAPIKEAERTEGTYSTASTHKSAALPKDAGSGVKIENGASGKFNLFAGAQAGVQVTGALNWAPPAEVVALSAVPVLTISGKTVMSRTSSWLSLARLSVDLAAAVGIGASAGFDISLYEGRLILNLKAALISGPGASGSFKFEVGYEAVVDIINLFRRELHMNNNQPLEWVEGSAADLMSKMSTLGAMGLDPGLSYQMGIDVIMSLYDTFTSTGKGGPVAHSIMTYPKPSELESWIVQLPSSALGPMLYTLAVEPKSFKIEQTAFTNSKKNNYTENECHLLQQKAITQILIWISDNAPTEPTLKLAKAQFSNACASMNKFGSFRPQEFQTNSSNLDRFMAVPVLRFENLEGERVRARYFEISKYLKSSPSTRAI